MKIRKNSFSEYTFMYVTLELIKHSNGAVDRV